jgi:FkbM family methyltransferase
MFGRFGVWLWYVRRDARMAGDLHTFRALRAPRFEAPAGEQTERLSVRIRGTRVQVRIRPGTFDLSLVKAILCEGSEYELPIALQPRVIVDAGANIGVTALYFAAVFPEARIFCFEPLPANLALLRENTAPFGDRIVVIPKGLSDRTAVLDFHPSPNAHDFSAGGFGAWGQTNSTQHLEVTTLDEAMREYGIPGIDVLKLDIEGSEGPALRGTSPEVLEKLDVIVGELHDVEDWAVIQHLSRTHRVGYRKVYWNTCTSSVAVNRRLAR